MTHRASSPSPFLPRPQFSSRGDCLIGQEMFKVMDRAQALERQGHRIYHLELGNPRMAPPSRIIEAAMDAFHTKQFGYTPMAGVKALREALAARYASLTGQVMADSHVVVSPANLLIHQFLDITCDPGDRVLLFTPAFPSYWTAASHLGLQVIVQPLSEGDGFHLTRQALDAALAAEPRAIIVNNANNPTGAVYAPAMLRELAERCERTGIWLLSDETYADLTFDRSFVTLASSRATQVVTISSFSKVFSIPGFRTGYAIAHETVAEKLALSNSTLYSCLPAFTQLGCLAGVAVLDDYASGVRARCVRLIGSCRDRIIRSRILRCNNPEAGFYLFVDIADTGLDDTTFCRRLLDEYHTAVTPGSSFGPAYASFIRVAACGQEEDVLEGVSRTVAFAEALGGCRVQAA